MIPLDEQLVAFGDELRAAGIPCAADAMAAFVAALVSDPEPRGFAFYWYARISLLHAIDDLPTFDAVFGKFWLNRTAPEVASPDSKSRGSSSSAARAPRSGETQERTVAVDSEAGAGAAGDEENAEQVFTAMSAEVLRERDFAALTADEWAQAERLLARFTMPVDLRRTRRSVLRARGRDLDVGATLVAEMRTFGLRFARRYRVPRYDVRPLVFLCDVSGSMAPYGRALLMFATMLMRVRAKIAVFSFGTRLTPLTKALAATKRPGAFGRALKVIPDWGGGTRIGASLQAFNRNDAERGGARGATVIIVSDGAEREDPALVGREMSLLRRYARRIVWVNPRKSDPAYEPLVRGMAAALPSVDAFVSGHNLRSLDAVAAAVRRGTLAAR